MEQLIVLSEELSEEWTDLMSTLTGHGYEIVAARSKEELAALMIKQNHRLALVDLDAYPMDNRFFRSLKSARPDASIFVASCSPYHPELKHAMTHHICACLRKPMDSEELLYWLKAVSRHSGTRDSTDHLGDDNSV